MKGRTAIVIGAAGGTGVGVAAGPVASGADAPPAITGRHPVADAGPSAT